MKRIFQRKARLACPKSDAATASNNGAQNSVESSGSSRKSATMIGLALSVAASGLVVHQQDDKASAAEQQAPVSSIGSEHHSAKAARSSRDGSEQQKGVDYVVREGDTIWSIADQHQVSKEEIISSNALDSENVLQVGQAIQIPLEPEPLPQVPSPVATEAVADVASTPRNLAHLQIQKASEVLSSEDVEASQPEADANRVPRAGALSQRSVDSISQNPKLGDSGAPALLGTESSPSNDAEVGLDVAPSAPVERGMDQRQVSLRMVQPPADTVAARPEFEGSARVTRHQAQTGETLESIALSHSVDIEAIVELNQLADPDELQAGQTLLLPHGDRSEVSLPISDTSFFTADSRLSSRAESSDAENEPVEVSALQQSGRSNNVISQPADHQIRPGETLAQISRSYGVSLQELIEHNSIRNPNRVFAGQVIRIPASVQVDSVSVSSAPVSTTDDETLVGYVTLPGSQYSVSDVPDLLSAPVMPLPVSPSPSQEGNAAEQDLQLDTQSTSEVEPAGESSSELSPNVYVEGLLSEIREIGQDAASSEEPLSSPSVSSESVAVDMAYLDTGDAVNPEFEQSPGLRQRLSETSQQSAELTAASGESELPASSESDLVAVAPVGSENYVPLGQPVTGRTVSPDLPPLPGADNYIPNGSATFNGYLWPARGVFTSGYGWRWGRMHRGIDIAAPVGTPIYAAAPGVIEFAGWNSGGYGNMVDIRHPDGSKTRYAHNSRNLVRAGQTVTQGQQIAEMGSTGYSTGPHVHFEIHVPNQGAVNPVALLPAR